MRTLPASPPRILRTPRRNYFRIKPFVLRLVPLFPFWLVNLVPAFLGVSLRTFVVGTFLGIIPGTFVYASFGNGLGALIDMGTTPDLSAIFKPEIVTPLIGLALLALVPVAYKTLKARRSRTSG